MTDLLQQRSMLVILLSACTAAQTAFQAADNAIDAGLRDALAKMTEQSELELTKLNLLIDGASS